MKLGKTLAVILIFATVVGCQTNTLIENDVETIEIQVKSPIGEHPGELVAYSEKIIRFEVLDELTEKNSTIMYYDDQSKGIEQFYSSREVNILSSLSKDEVSKKMVIFANEATKGKTHYKLKGNKTLEKGKVYYGFLVYSEQLNGYVIIATTSALLYDDFEKNDVEDTVAEFFCLVNLYPETFTSNKEQDTSKIYFVYGIKDFAVVEQKIFSVDGKEISLYYSYEKETNIETIGYKGSQFQVKGRFLSE
jgi:hypothetical protein